MKDKKQKLVKVIGAGGSKPKPPQIADDTIASTAFYTGLYALGEGEILGPVDGLRSIKLNKTPVVDSAGNFTKQGVQVDYRLGTIDQSHIPGFPEVRSEYPVGVEVLAVSPWSQYIQNTQLSAVAVRLEFPRLSKTDTKGNVSGTRVNYRIAVVTDGGAEETIVNTFISEKVSNPYQRTYRIDLPKAQTGWMIKVYRATPDSDSDLLQNKMNVSAYTEIIDVKMRYPHTALVGIRYDAREFNQLADFEAEVYGRIVQVPRGYNPTTREYPKLWDGTWELKWTDNPAWILRDIIINKRFGLGKNIDEKYFDKWEAYRCAQFCDELVDDGEGGKEPRFTCNMNIQSQVDAFTMLQDISSTFRAYTYWTGDRIAVGLDAPDDPVYIFNRSNIQGHFEYVGTRQRDRHTVAKVMYDDYKNGYVTTPEYVFDNEAIADYGINVIEISAFGCIKRSEAQRRGIWALRTENLQLRTVSFVTGLEGFLPQPGSVIGVADELIQGRVNGGRIKNVSADGMTITLDRNTTVMKPGDKIIFNTSLISAETYVIASISPDNTKVTLTTKAQNIEKESAWAIISNELEIMYFRVQSIVQKDGTSTAPTQFTITAVQYDKDKYLEIDTGAYVTRSAISVIEPKPIATPENVKIESNIYFNQGIKSGQITVTWKQDTRADKYEVHIKKDDGSFINLGVVQGNTYTIENIYSGEYIAKVIAVDNEGNRSLPGYSELTEVEAEAGAPLKPLAFTAKPILFGIELSWRQEKVANNIAFTEIEYATTETHVDSKNLGSYPYPADQVTLSGLTNHVTYHYRARNVDKNGITSEWTSWISATPSADPDAILDIIGGHISQGDLDNALQDYITTIEQSTATAQQTANQAKTDAAAAATAARNAANAAAVAAADAATVASNLSKEITDRLAGDAKEAQDRQNAILAKANEITTATDKKVADLRSETNTELGKLNNGITQVTTDYKAADQAISGQLTAYKQSNDAAVASVLQKAESAVSSSAANASQITAINGQILQINGVLSTKLDASVIQKYYTSAQTDSAIAGSITAYDSNLQIGGVNLQANADFTSTTLRNGWLPSSGTMSNDAGTLKYTSTTQTNSNRIEKRPVGLINGKTYTLSFLLKCPQIPEFRSFVGANKLSESFPAVFDPTLYQRYSFTFTVTDASSVILRVYFTNISVGNVVNLDKEQLEEGNKATTWKLAEQDTQDSLAANAQAIRDTNTEVSRVNGIVTTNSSDIVTLKNNVNTINGNLATKADSSALNSLDSKVTVIDGKVTTQAGEITTLKNNVATINGALSSKADASAFNALDSKVTTIDGKVTTQATQITGLQTSVNTINGTLATKADASALNNYYTKTEADAATAGQISTFDSKLVIGGQNLYYGPNPVVLRSQTSPGRIVFAETASGNTQRFNYLTEDNLDLSNIQIGDPTIASIEIYVPSTDTSDYTIQFGTYRFSGTSYVYAPTVDVKTLPKDKWIKLTTDAGTYTSGQPATGINLVFNLVGRKTAGDEIRWRNFMMEKASKASAYSESDKSFQGKLDVNATAINTTNTEVSRINGVVVSQGQSITNLQNSVNTINGNLATKADASALNALDSKVTTIDGKVTAQAGQITSLQTSVNTINGTLANKADASALNNYYTKTQTDTAIAGQISTFNASLTVGVDNLLPTQIELYENGYWSGTDGSPVADNRYIKTKAAVKIPVVEGNTYSLRGNTRIVLVYFNDSDARIGAYDSGTSTAPTTAKTITPPTGTAYARAYLFTNAGALAKPNPFNQQVLNSLEILVVKGTPTKIVWQPSALGTQTSLDANATAINTTNTEVSRINGVVVSQGQSITSLQNSVNTINGNLATKADASALNALDSKVTTIDGKVTAQAGQITSLQSSVNTINGTLANKADASALNNYYTKTQTDTAIAGAVSTYNASLFIGGDNLWMNDAAFVFTGSDTGGASHTAGKITTTSTIARINAYASTVNYLNKDAFILDKPVVISLDFRIAPGTPTANIPANGEIYFYHQATPDMATPKISLKTLTVGQWYRLTTTAALAKDLNILFVFDYSGNNRAGLVYEYRNIKLEQASIASAYTPSAKVMSEQLSANATAIQNTNTEVSRINGVVVSQGQSITNLQNSVNTINGNLATKADASALNSVTSRVETAEGKIASLTSDVSSLQSSVNTINGNLATKADASALNALTTRVATAEGKIETQATQVTNLTSSLNTTIDAITIKDTRSTNQPPSWYLANYPRRRVNEFKTQTVIGVNTFFGGTYCNLETIVYYGDLSGGPIIQTATSASDPSLYVQRQSSSTSAWTTWSQPIKDLRDTLNTKASAQAVSELTTQVNNIDGRLTSTAQQTTQISTTVNNQTATIQEQSQSIDGIRLMQTFKFDNNGVVSGYGMISELQNGIVKTQFGINANDFFIGAPGNGKKPFVVLTTPGMINGVTVPAGTYIDSAYIASGTIKTAQIGDLSVTTAKIQNLAVDTAKIKDAAITNLKIADLAVDSAKIKDLSVDTIKIAKSAVTVVYEMKSRFNDSQYVIINDSNNKKMMSWIQVKATAGTMVPSNCFAELWLMRGNVELAYRKYTVSNIDPSTNFGSILIDDFFMFSDQPIEETAVSYWVKMRTYASRPIDHTTIQQEIGVQWIMLEAKR